MTDWSCPEELRSPCPRKVEWGPDMRSYFIAILLGFAVSGGPLGYVLRNEHRINSALIARGVERDARVNYKYVDNGGRRKSFVVEFTYSLVAEDRAKMPQRKSKFSPAESTYNRISIGDTIPVLYDPLDPSLVRINFNNQIRRGSSWGDVNVAIMIVTAVGGGFIFSMARCLRIYFKQKWLLTWGMAVPAQVISEEQYYTVGGKVKGVLVSRLFYRFIDPDGRAISAMRDYVLGVSKSGLLTPGRRTEILSNPTVLYDPSSPYPYDNILYPSGFVRVKGATRPR